MAGPWEKFAPQGSVGPWTKFAQPEAVDTTPAPTEEVQYDPMGMPLGGAYTNTLPSKQQAIDTEGAMGAFADSALDHSLPIVGPAIKGGVDRIVAVSKKLAGGKSYSEELKDVQDKTKKLKEKYPEAATVGHVVGSTLGLGALMRLAPALMGLDASLPLSTNIIAGGSTNGLLAAGDAAVRGEPIIASGTTGALIGSAVPILGKVIGGIFNLITPEARTAISGFDKKAVEWAIDLAKKDGLTEAQIANMINTKGPEYLLGEYGTKMQGAMEKMGSAPSGPGKDQLTSAITGRAAPETAVPRVNKALDEAFGPAENMTQRTLETISDRTRASDPKYIKYRDKVFQPTPEIKAFTIRLEKHGLLAEAELLAELEATATSQPVAPMRNFFTTGERKDWPTAQSWNNVKKAIDDKIAKSYNSRGEATEYTHLYTQMKNQLDSVLGRSKVNKDAFAAWKDARETWGSFSEIKRAQEAGKNAWSKGYTFDQMAEDVTNVSAPARAAYNQAARANLAERMGNLREEKGLTAVEDLLLAPNMKKKVAFLTGNKSYDPKKLIKSLEDEGNYSQVAKDYKATAKSDARKEAEIMMTPNPENTLLGKFEKRFPYAAHVFNPARMLPGYGTVKNILEKRQSTAFDRARDDLAKMMSAKGSQAQEYARALLAQRPPSNSGLATASVLRALTQPVIPNVQLPYGLSDRQ